MLNKFDFTESLRSVRVGPYYVERYSCVVGDRAGEDDGPLSLSVNRKVSDPDNNGGTLSCIASVSLTLSDGSEEPKTEISITVTGMLTGNEKLGIEDFERMCLTDGADELYSIAKSTLATLSATSPISIDPLPSLESSATLEANSSCSKDE
ncbi:hypothetical protein [Gordonibacter sp. Marseille-P4307]|uniref:hypothetical protein n=1 Tax=Gordonibacter sp. Marseille-P4307 TaxID=2161815 RepID=UPI000F538688|nr:hypothetical protein [Gordonibacter sp. Marseille-P4307]